MRDTFWLVCTKRSVIKMTKNRPALERNERTIRIAVEIPDTAFADAPAPVVTIVVQERQVVAPDVQVEIVDPDPAPTSEALTDA